MPIYICSKLFMKILFTIVSILFSTIMYSQERNITVSVQNQTVNFSLDDDNSEKVIRLNSSTEITSIDQLVITVLFWKEEQDWSRKFIINDVDGNDIVTLTLKKKAGIYCEKLNTIIPLLQKGKVYDLYTVSLPKDPKIAMLVKVPRVLVCKISVD